jgi:hypothetical protein
MSDDEPSRTENSFVINFHYEGRDVPIEVVGPPPEEMDKFLDALADFLWANRKREPRTSRGASGTGATKQETSGDG